MKKLIIMLIALLFILISASNVVAGCNRNHLIYNNFMNGNHLIYKNFMNGDHLIYHHIPPANNFKRNYHYKRNYYKRNYPHYRPGDWWRNRCRK